MVDRRVGAHGRRRNQGRLNWDVVLANYHCCEFRRGDPRLLVQEYQLDGDRKMKKWQIPVPIVVVARIVG